MKVGTGIGCGVIVDGPGVPRARRAAPATSGTSTSPSPTGARSLCRCGNENCLEAIAGGGALLRDAVAAGLPVDDDAARSSSWPRRATAPALELVRDAGRTIGTVLAALVNFFNPHRIVMTGGVAQAGVPLLAGIREAVYRPLACRWPPGRWRSRSATRPTSPAGSAPPCMAIEEFLDEDSVAGPRRQR